MNTDWNDFIEKSLWGDVLQFEQWAEVKGKEGWRSRKCESANGKVRSQCLIKSVPLLGNYLYVPHGPVFETVEDLATNIRAWKEAVVALAKEEKCFAIEIEPKIGHLVVNEESQNDVVQKNTKGLEHFTNPRVLEIFKQAGFRETGRNMQPIYKLLYDLSLSDEELMSLMSKSTRYNVRYAEKHGVVVKEYLPDDPLIETKLKQFYDLLLEMQKRAKGYPVRPYSSFVKLFEVFKGTKNLSLFEASYEGDVIIMTISPRTKGWCSSFYAGSNRLHPNLKAPYLIRWEAIKKAKEYGSKVYDFWGIIPNSKQHKGYSDNKLSFGGTRIDHVGLLQLPINSSKTKVFNTILPMRAKISELKRTMV